jgi:hypothetical protein
MTHDELLQEINTVEHPWWMQDALRAVVELHQPLDNLIAEFCSHCTEMSGKDIYTLYPCLTIKAIEKELQ